MRLLRVGPSDDDAAMTRVREVVGYPSGPGAPLRATARALARLDGARTLVLVAGVSDQIAVEVAAAVHGRDLDQEGVVVVPLGGAHAIARFLATSGRLPGVRLAGLCDVREREVFRRALVAAGVLPAPDADLEEHGFRVCVEDLEDELVRAVGTAEVEALVESQGDLGAFRSLQNQPAWRGRAPDAQLRRFLSSGARRKLRYARLLVEAAAGRDALPRPITALLDAV
jgi:hypothetical protein